MFSLTDLQQFYEILSKYQKSFSFSPTFVENALKKFDDFLKALQQKANDNDQTQFNYFLKIDPKSDDFCCFKLVLLIKMRLFMMIRKMHDFLTVLLQLIIIDQENSQAFSDEKLSFKSTIDEILPDCTTRRSITIQKVHNDQILDFYFSHDAKNDFILTNEGVFKVNQADLTQITFSNQDEDQKIQQILKKSNRENAKIAFSKGILYLLCGEDRTIHKVVVSSDEELDRKAEIREKKLKSAEEHSTKSHPPKKETPENKNAAKKAKSKENKMTKKKLKEKEKKEKRQQRQKARFEVEQRSEINTESIQIELQELPIVTCAVYNDYVRIVQRKSRDNGQLKLIFTNIDLDPNNRCNYDIEAAFDFTKTDKKFVQAQNEIEIDEKVKIRDVLLSEDYVFFSCEDSSFQKWIIFNDGKIEYILNTSSPFVFYSKGTMKMDNKSFLYNIIPLHKDDKFCTYVTQMYIPKTDHFFRSDCETFLKFPYLQKLSDIIDNCSQFILNRRFSTKVSLSEVSMPPFGRRNKTVKKVEAKDPYQLTVSPDEICSLTTSFNEVIPQLDTIKSLVKDIKDDDLRQLFITLLIKLTGVNFIYEINRKLCNCIISPEVINDLKAYKSFVLDLYSMIPPSNSSEYDIIIRESMIFTLSIAGKFLFLPDSYQELHELMNKLISNDETSKLILKSLSSFMFTHVSSLYTMNQSLFDKFMELKDEINLYDLFKKNIIYVLLEVDYASKSMKDEFIESISPYISALFQYMRYIFSNESINFQICQSFLSYILTFNSKNILFSLMLEKELIESNNVIYDRIKKIPGVIDNDNSFLSKNQDMRGKEIHKFIKTIESKHPYNPDPVPISDHDLTKEDIEKISKLMEQSKPIRFKKATKKYYYEDLGIIDFGTGADKIFIHIDNKTQMAPNDKIFIYSSNENMVIKPDDETLNKYFLVNSSKIRVAIGRKIKDSQKIERQLWGCKLIAMGVSSDVTILWSPNIYLNYYAYFIQLLMDVSSTTVTSTKLRNAEDDFKLVLSDNIIQGIKLEDIDNYESNAKEEKEKSKKLKDRKISKGISRGISRGISYDSQNDSQMDIKLKKNFINDIITINEENPTPAKRLMDALYNKTSNQNRIRLNKTHQQILDCERYFAACLFKQLGLITTCINFIQVLVRTEKDELKNLEYPSSLILVWKKVYALRRILFLEYQKLKKANTETELKNAQSDFENLIKNILQKCKLLLYSNPILQFKDDSDEIPFESTAKSILSFLTSKIPLSDISKLIDIRKERISISKESISLMISFLDKCTLFESAKPIFAYFYNAIYPIANCLGVKQDEIEEYKELLGSLTLKMVSNIYTQPSISMISNHNFIIDAINELQKSDFSVQTSKVLIDMLQRNKNNTSFLTDFINFNLIKILILIAFETENNELIDYLVSLISLDEIDNKSKKLILLCLPGFIQFIPNIDNLKVLDESLAFSILSNNKKDPEVVISAFSWIASIFEKSELTSQNHKDFILHAFKEIGKITLNKSCTFIDDSFDHSFHISISAIIVSFIRLLYNSNNKELLSVIHDILTNKINDIQNEDNNEDAYALIGLFISFEQCLSGTMPSLVKNFNPRMIDDEDEEEKETMQYQSYSVAHENKNLILNEKEIDNILKLHEQFLHHKCFDENQNYDYAISDTEILENILLASFYSFLSIIMQIEDNAKILMSEAYIQRTLSIFNLAMKSIPSFDNNVLRLSSSLINATYDKKYKPIENDPYNLHHSFRFVKMNFGEIEYSKENGNDLIKSNEDYLNIFICNRPFNCNCETYYELKINKIGNNNIFIGFIDSQETKFDKAFGFGNVEYQNIFCRKSPLLNDTYTSLNSDEIMKNEQISENLNENKFLIKEGDTIGCCYTPEYTYLTINGNLTPYRISNQSLRTYIPIILIDHDRIELEVVRNVSIVDKNDNFLKINDVPEGFFEEKDIKTLTRKPMRGYLRQTNISRSNIYLTLGLKVFFDSFSNFEYDIESIKSCPKELYQLVNGTGIIKDIIPIKNNPFVSIVKIKFSKRKEIVELDSRFLNASDESKILSRLEEIMTNSFQYDSRYLPISIHNSTDANLIKQYSKNKMIKESSKSIAIIMTRYLSFILVDYLRHSKSKLLQDEGFDSKEMSIIVKALSHSLPTITQFVPKFDFTLDDKQLRQFIIFSSEQNEFEDEDENNNNNNMLSFRSSPNYKMQRILYKSPGDSNMFNYAFKLFLKHSESFLCSRFLSSLMKELFEITKGKSLSLTQIYDLIPSQYKFESISPLPEKLNILSINDHIGTDNSSGIIPILISSIPEQLPCIKFCDKKLRYSSDQVSYFQNTLSVPDYQLNLHFEWKYNINKLPDKPIDPKSYKNYKLQSGMFLVENNLEESLLKGPLGFIQMVFNILQSVIDSEYLYEKQKDTLCCQIFEDILHYSSIKDPLVHPFIEPIIISIITMIGFSKIFSEQKVTEQFSQLSKAQYNKLYRMESFPSSTNEASLIFNLFSNLIQNRNIENTTKDLSLLFDDYYSSNHDLFDLIDNDINTDFVEGNFNNELISMNEKKKSYQLIYLLYYYSILLNNENQLPYPKFVFIHDWMRQHFGGFQIAITKGDITKYKKDEKDEIQYKSTTYNNDTDLECSCNLTNIYSNDKQNKGNMTPPELSFQVTTAINNGLRPTLFLSGRNNFRYDIIADAEKIIQKKKDDKKKKEKDTYKIIVHQINDDKRIELPQTGETVHVSFPLEVLVYKKNKDKDELIDGSAFVINFGPTKEQHQQYFISHYEEIQEDFRQFLSLGKYDSELSNIVLTTKESTKDDNDDNEENQDDDTFFAPSVPRYGFYSHRFGNQMHAKENRDDFKQYEQVKIPKEIEMPKFLSSSSIKPNVISLRYSTLNYYSSIIEFIMVTYSGNQNSHSFRFRGEHACWTISLSSKDELQNVYSKQIIRPARSMNTESKFKFVNSILRSESKGHATLSVVFNRFEQQKFMEQFEENKKVSSSNKLRPLFVQFMEQVDSYSLREMKVQGDVPFRTELAGENAIDAGGPGRELFSSLIMELMNEHVGLFTYNANRRHKLQDTNQEDLIPNKFLIGDVYNYEENDKNNFFYYEEPPSRFEYAGVLIAVCIVSDLPQPMKLASFIWEYLSSSKVSLKSVYEIDKNFKDFIEKAENLLNRMNESPLTDEKFEAEFPQMFDIRDSFDNVSELILSGSKTRVTKDKLGEFIELAKNFRVHEFDQQLKELKKGFDTVMCYKNITKKLNLFI